MRKKVGVLTSSRADYWIYKPLIDYLKTEKWLELDLIVFGTHLIDEMKNSLSQIENDFSGLVYKVGYFKKTNKSEEVVKAYAEVINSFSSFWVGKNYNCLIALGDRFEMSAAVQSTIPFHYKVAHIHGGEITLGAIDNIYRHQISIASKLHFTATDRYSKKVSQLTGNTKNIFNVGSLSLSNLNLNSVKPWVDVRNELGIPDRKFILITIHPETTKTLNFNKEISELSKVFEELLKKYFLIFTGTNYDQNFKNLDYFFKTFSENNLNSVKYINSLGKENYFSALKNCSFIMGNSSSGIIEAASFGKYVYNLGNRQKGRIYNQNTINLGFESKSILTSINKLQKKGLDYNGGNVYYKKKPTQRNF